jgi:peptidoglycan/LPS O-acetylase OafA/YrhL
METGDKRSRLLYVDNIRWAMIVLVLVVHSNVIYGPVGQFFGYEDRSTSGEVSDIVFILISVLIQAFFMGLLFLVAGYFVPGSHSRKGSGKFVRDRFMRLGVPSLIFIIFLAPLISYPLHFSDEMSLVEYLSEYLPNPLNWDSGPMWFAVALLLFSAVYTYTPTAKIWNMFAGPLTRMRVSILILLVSAGTFLVRIPYPVGTDVWNMQLCFFTQYIALFIVGVLAFRNDWLASLTKKDGRFWSIVALLSIFLLLIPIMIFGGALDDNLEPYEGGLHWQAMMLSLWEQVFGISVCIWLLVWFRERHNNQSRLHKKLSDNAFAVYLFHPPILLGIAVLLVDTGLPGFAKFVILLVSALVATFALSEFVFRRIPGLKKVL